MKSYRSIMALLAGALFSAPANAQVQFQPYNPELVPLYAIVALCGEPNILSQSKLAHFIAEQIGSVPHTVVDGSEYQPNQGDEITVVYAGSVDGIHDAISCRAFLGDLATAVHSVAEDRKKPRYSPYTVLGLPMTSTTYFRDDSSVANLIVSLCDTAQRENDECTDQMLPSIIGLELSY